MSQTGAAHYPFVPGGGGPTIVSAEGSWLVTSTGERILDAGGGALVVNIGHGRPEPAEAAAQALSKLGYVIPPWPTPARIALRDRLVERWLPEGLTRVGFVSGGSESTDSAIRLARAHHAAAGRTGRWKVIGRTPSYHGTTIATLAAGHHEARRRGFEPALLEFPHVPWDDAEALDKTIEAEDPDTVAAFIVEPVIGSAGCCYVPPEGWFSRVGEICRRHGVLLVADEVMTGFGRTGKRFGVEHFGVTPDILVGGKGLSGGYAPIGGIYAGEHVLAPLAETGSGFMFFTFGAQDLCCAISDRVLQVLEDEQLVERAARQGAVLRQRLEQRLGADPHVSDIRGLGLMQGVELVRERDPFTWWPAGVGFAQKVVAEALQRGVWVYPAGSGSAMPDGVMLGPPFTITDEEIDQTVDVLGDAIKAAAAAAAAAVR